MSRITIKGLHQSFLDEASLQTHPVLTDVRLEIATGELLVLLGPSGCGKSTLLNLLAGFFAPTSGSIEIDGRVLEGSGDDRAMVFQNADAALFPWLTVFENVEFGLKMKHVDLETRRSVVQKYLGIVGLTGHEKKRPAALSGGMKQRVQLARVLALGSPVLLMDEPFGALDAMTRRQMQKELVRIWTETKKTIVFVTHDISEALLLGQRIAIMKSGPNSRIEELHNVELPYPRDATSAEFNLWHNIVSSHFEGGGGI